MRRIFLACALACVSIGAGCAARKKNVTDLPPGVTMQQAQSWDTTVAQLHKIASTVSTFRNTLTDLHSAAFNGEPVASDAFYADALRTIARIDQAEIAAEDVLRQSPQNFTPSAKQQVAVLVQRIAAELQHLNTTSAIGINNPKSLEEVSELISQASSHAALILAL